MSSEPENSELDISVLSEFSNPEFGFELWSPGTLVISYHRLKFPADRNALQVCPSPAKPETTTPPSGQQAKQQEQQKQTEHAGTNSLSSSPLIFRVGGRLDVMPSSTWWLTSSRSMSGFPLFSWLMSFLSVDCNFCLKMHDRYLLWEQTNFGWITL